MPTRLTYLAVWDHTVAGGSFAWSLPRGERSAQRKGELRKRGRWEWGGEGEGRRVTTWCVEGGGGEG